MATHAYVLVLREDVQTKLHSAKLFYQHWDGYPSGALRHIGSYIEQSTNEVEVLPVYYVSVGSGLPYETKQAWRPVPSLQCDFGKLDYAYVIELMFEGNWNIETFDTDCMDLFHQRVDSWLQVMKAIDKPR